MTTDLRHAPATSAWLTAQAWLCGLLFGLGLALAGAATAGEPMRIVHAAPEVPGDQRASYFWELLDAALASNRDKYGEYSIEAYPLPMSHARIIAEMEAGDQGRINIFVPATNPELESRLLPIRVPVDKGLLGYRAFLIMPKTQSQLDTVRTADDLRQFIIGQGTPWADSRILEANGFKLILSNDYAGQFKMLEAGRFDLFSRGIDEIQAEWTVQKARVPELQIERGLILHYRMPRYYFVPRTARGERMAERIEDGLRRLALSGEFDRRYAAYKRRVLGELNLAGRHVLRIPNPFFQPRPPYDEKRWWDDLASELKPPVPAGKAVRSQ